MAHTLYIMWLCIYARKGGAVHDKNLITVDLTFWYSTHGSKNVQGHDQTAYD